MVIGLDYIKGTLCYLVQGKVFGDLLEVMLMGDIALGVRVLNTFS